MEHQKEKVLVGIADFKNELLTPWIERQSWTNSAEFGFDEKGVNKCENGIDEDNNGKVGDCYGWDFSSNDNSPDVVEKGAGKDHEPM